VSKYHKLLLFIIALIIAASFAVRYKKLNEGLDIAGGMRAVLQAEGEKDPTSDQMQSVVKVLRKRCEGFQGVAETSVQTQGKDRVIVELPGLKNQQEAIDTIKSTAKLEFYWLRDVEGKNNPAARYRMVRDENREDEEIISFQDKTTNEILRGDTPEGQALILKNVVNAYHPETNPNGHKPELTGDDLDPVSAGEMDPSRGPVISIRFNKSGTERFYQFTRKHVDDYLAIFLGGKILTAPTIKVIITDGRAQIEGVNSLTEANHTAQFLNAGALPVSLKVVQLDKVEATLGKETVDQALMAGLIGLILVALFMLVYYKLPGLLADVALCIYALLTYAAFKMFNVTMTLPGLAGFILSIGMAVDANILIFERLKEELRSGKTLRASIDAGFGRAFTAIFDSNICTLITAFILMWFGTGTIKSFAFTLSIGVIISMFTAITVTRTFLHLLVSLPALQKPSLFGLGRSWFHNWQPNVVGRRNVYFALSALIIIPGVVFYFLNLAGPGHSGLKKGIEFKSGTSIQMTFQRANLDVNFKDPVDQYDVSKAVADAGINGTVEMKSDKSATISAALGPKDTKELDELKRLFKDRALYIDGNINAEYLKPLKPVTVEDVNSIASSLDIESAVQMSTNQGQQTAFIKTTLPPTADKKLEGLEKKLQEEYGMAKVSSSGVGPVVSKELTQKAILAVLFASLAIIIYLSARFAIGGFLNGLKYGVCAIGATLHDVLLIVGLFAGLGYLLGWEVDTLFVTAVLTIIGFSTHYTIVVFDRIRENMKHRMRGESYEGLCNRSILQTFSRSINTSLTVVLTIVALLALGGPIIKQFYIALLIGIISGTYSSIFNATPLLVVWESIAGRRQAGIGQRKAAEDKPMVAKERAKELKPVAVTSMIEDAEEDQPTDTDRTKVKPKKKKRRY
jgi:SecD/SecF fusion protein